MLSSAPYSDSKNIYVSMAGNLYPPPISFLNNGWDLNIIETSEKIRQPIPEDASKCLFMDKDFVSRVAWSTQVYYG